MLTFKGLRTANLQRCFDFKDRQGRLCHEGGVHSWSTVQWSNAMCGEAGETANQVKKIDRGDFDGDANKVLQAYDDLADEIADVIIYADLLAAKAGIDLGEAVRAKFNKTSRKVKSSVTL